MAEEYGDKTEAPTPRRRTEAREQGNVARSPDLSAAVLLIGMLILLNWYGGGVVKALKAVMGYTLDTRSVADLSITSTTQSAVKAIIHVGTSLLPLFIGGMLIAIAVNLAQVGFHLNPKRLQPNLGALNPIKGLGRLFGGGRGKGHIIFSLLKLVLVTWVAWSAVSGRLGQIVTAQNLDLLQAFALGCEMVWAIGIRIGVVLLILALLDYAYQKWRHEQQLKMTKQEVKEEMKRMEGDPKIKSRRRQLAIQLLTQKLKKDVPTADVVVTNPTHYAIALKYDSSKMGAPKVIAKGQDFLAQRIREIAIEAGVPILERPPLARALYKAVEVGQEIPENFYAAVAEILAYVYELSGKVKRRQTA
jgi:flagellar biosynthetic protein FlhB